MIELSVYAQLSNPKPQFSLTDRDFIQFRRLLQHSSMAHSATSRLETFEVAFQPAELRCAALSLTQQVQELVFGDI